MCNVVGVRECIQMGSRFRWIVYIKFVYNSRMISEHHLQTHQPFIAAIHA